MVAMVLANTGGSMCGPLLPLYLKSLDARVVQIGLFFTLSQIIPLTLQILGGWISDSVGRLRSIAMGSVAGVFSYLGLILAPTWQWVLVGEGLSSVIRSLVGPSFGAFIAEESAEESRARVFGITETIFMAVAVVGPPLGGLLADTYGFQIMLAVAGGLYLIATIIRVAMARTAAKSKEANPKKLSFVSLKRDLGLIVRMSMAGGLGVGLISPAYQSMISKAVPEKMLGTAFGFLQTSLGVVSLPAPWIGAQLWERVSPRFTFTLTAWAGLLALIPVYFKFKLPDEGAQEKTDQ